MWEGYTTAHIAKVRDMRHRLEARRVRTPHGVSPVPPIANLLRGTRRARDATRLSGMASRSKRQARFWSAILSRLLLGMGFGALGSLMVNCALVEISLSPLFAVAFGAQCPMPNAQCPMPNAQCLMPNGQCPMPSAWPILPPGVLFLLSGGTVAWTVALEPGGGESRVLLLSFAALVSTSGVLCFLLERDWSHGLSRSAKVPLYLVITNNRTLRPRQPTCRSRSLRSRGRSLTLLPTLTKVPLYALLGVSLSFSTHFTALDLYGKLREVLGCDKSGGASPTIVRTRWQARLLALVAVVTQHGQSAPARLLCLLRNRAQWL